MVQFSLDQYEPLWFNPIMNLSEWLTKNNTSSDTFAISIGVNPVSIRRYATGARIPQRNIMAKITEATNGEVTPNSFYGHKSQESSACQQNYENGAGGETQ